LSIDLEKKKERKDDSNYRHKLPNFSTQWSYSIANKLLLKIIEKDVEVYTTMDIIEEFSEVLKRDFKYNDEEINTITSDILSLVKLIIPTKNVDVVKEDLEDNKIIECALESKSDYIITYDLHLLKLKEYRSIKIVKPEDFLKLI